LVNIGQFENHETKNISIKSYWKFRCNIIFQKEVP
jgi:hypothetical protein